MKSLSAFLALAMTSFALSLANLVFIPVTHAKSISKEKLIKFTDSKTKTTFMYPKGSVVKSSNHKITTNNPFLLNGQTIARIKWGNMIAKINVFDVVFDYYHIDWLSAYAERLKLPMFNVLTLTNSSNLKFGNLEYLAGKGTTSLATAYLAIAGRRGYLISGQGPRSNPLVDTIVSTINLSGEDWGKIDKTKIVKFAGHDLKIRSDLIVRNVVKDKFVAKVISNNTSLGDSSLLIVLKKGSNRKHKTNLEEFRSELSKLKLKATIVLNHKYETTFDLVSETDDKYVGFLTTTKSGISVSLVVPSLHEVPSAWLSGKYYYIRALQALK